MALTINAKSYVADGFSPDSVHFQGPANTTTVKDQFIQKRYATRSKSMSFSGFKKFLLKLARTHTLTGALTPVAEGSVQVLFDLPVGVSDADRDSYCNDLGAYIASVGFKAALKAEQVNG